MIVWLASFPKSGNTWLRILLAHLLEEQPIDINDITVGTSAANRRVVDEWLGFESGYLSHAEVDQLRPEIYRRLAHARPDPFFMKVHDAYRLNPDGNPVFPTDATKGVIYIVRDARDVAVSLASHFGIDVDEAIRKINDPDFSLSWRTDRLPVNLRQLVHDWSRHADSWLASPLPVLVVRYEDLLLAPAQTLQVIAGFCGLRVSEQAVLRAVDLSTFSRLRRLEETGGFAERVQPRVPFFREGKSGVWRRTLTDQQQQQIVSAHRVMMKRFGYAVDETTCD